MSPLFVVLLAGHLVGDFVLQSDGMARDKCEGKGMVRHSVVVTLASGVLLGAWPTRLEKLVAIVLLLVALFVSHLVIDAVKSFLGGEGVKTFLADQIAHLAAVWILAGLFQGILETSLWMPVIHLYYPVLAFLSGLILNVKFGSILIEKAMKPVVEQLESRQEVGLRNGGRWIGMLERALTYLLVLAGQFSAIGFLFAAKSILRFGEIREPGQRKEAEYIIIGTFMSFGWALAVSMVFAWLLQGVL